MAEMIQSVPNLKWAFLIEPSYSWFESFADHFSSPDLAFIVDTEDDKPNAYALSSQHFNELTNAAEVIERAISLKAVLDGALYLQHGKDFRPFQLLDLVNLENDLRHGMPRGDYEVIAAPFSSNSANLITKWRSASNPFGNFVTTMLWLAREDESSRGLLQFLGLQGCTWISLYALLDFMKTDGLSAKEIATFSNTSEAEIKRFTHTANNFSAIGPLCRHGDLGQHPPRNPMRLGEASEILLPAAQKFLLKKISDLGLQKRWQESNR
ncbi:hypothetical protein C5F52_28350 [Limnohabitans sp. TS-CS-82]|jgi:hypothetical protein|uniref:hypothetical protein n=1 Tax=Limnohabitans sp. TS-CS-82 TaxID=2094193 RepID=UPI000CF24962|nr:hypothetical protein [Limnohabitans sp. TS-CS-82]PQA79798.1 hypothetical protein C5F52_28350 [Limnohabitans sp. TS-CS-82]